MLKRYTITHYVMQCQRYNAVMLLLMAFFYTFKCMLNASTLLLYPHPHRVIIYFIEAKVTSHHTYFGHLYVEYLPLLCMVAAATKSKGVKIYSIFAELFFLKNVCYSTLYGTYLIFVFIQVSVNIAF